MNILEDLIKKRNRVVEEIGELLSMIDSTNCDIAELRGRLQGLNDDIEATKEENAEKTKENEQEFLEVLESGDYSAMAKVYRRLNMEMDKWRKCREEKYNDCDSYYSIEELREERRRIGDKMLEVVE